jgi:hypothetical protein
MRATAAACHSELPRCCDLLRCRCYLPTCRRSASVFTCLDRRSASASTTPARRSTPEPSRAAAPRAPLNPPAPSRLLVVEAETPKRCHRSRAAAVESIHDVSLHRSSSGNTCSTPSTARVPGTSTSTSTPASTSSPVCRRRLFPARARHHGELPTVSLPPPFASNRSHHHPGPLPGYFPADQRWSIGRISPVSRRRQGGGDFPPLFPRLDRIAE